MALARTEPVDDSELRALGTEVVRLSRRRAYAGSVLEDSAFRILLALVEKGPMSSAVLASTLQLDRSTISRQVAAAVRAGLVERSADPDRAGRLLLPTEAGIDAYAHDGGLRTEVFNQAIHDLGPERAAALLRDLRDFNDAFDRAHARVSAAPRGPAQPA